MPSPDPSHTDPQQGICQKNGCEAEARQSVILGWRQYEACPEHYGEMLEVLGVR